jgi:D-glycero-alpha-D-manno-heptose-7-phosphate kinase
VRYDFIRGPSDAASLGKRPWPIMNASATPTVFNASAPLRLDFAGGWTDVPPFSAREGGLVVNAAIGIYAHATLELGGESIFLASQDLDDQLRLTDPAELRVDGRLALLQAALRMFPVSPCGLTTRSEAPAGSGLGSSGALDVALVSALSRAAGKALTADEIAREAWRLEAVEAGMPGGKQDQFASAFGGFNSLRFADPTVEVSPLEIDPAFAEHLKRHLVLCYTGTSRVSGDTIRRVMSAYEQKEPTVTSALRRMKDIAGSMVEALRSGDEEAVGALLADNWVCQQRLDPAMRTGEMARLEQAVNEAGALGGKAAGAGAGGCMFFLAREDGGRVADAARRVGAKVLPVSWAKNGVREW